MKKIIFITILGVLFTSCNTNREKEIRSLEKFDSVNLVGNIELHLKKNAEHAIDIKANNTSDLVNLITEVSNGELFIYNKKDGNNYQNSKYTIYLNHSGISNLSLTGVVKLISNEVIDQEILAVSGNGIFHGNLETSVKELSVDLNGISNFKISGYADTSNLKVTGIGMINASNLDTKNNQNDSVGMAIVYK